MNKFDDWRIATPLAFFLASASASAAITSVDLGQATLTGQPVLSGYTGGYGYPVNSTIDLAAVTVTSSNGQVGFAFDPGVSDFYYGGYRPSSNYSINGSLNVPSGFALTGKDGVTLDNSQAGYRISGEISLIDQATVTLSTGQSFSGKGVRSVADVYTFTTDVPLAGLSGPLLYWSGFNPYYPGANGSASVFSVANIKITKIEYHTGIQSVPEAGTWALMSLGILGVLLAARRQRPR